MRKGATVVLFLITSMLIFCKDANVDIKEWKYGFALDSRGAPLFFDDNVNAKSKLPVNGFSISKVDTAKLERDKIIGASILVFDNEIRIDDALKNQPQLSKSHKRIKYKISNSSGFVSTDGQQWEKLNIKYLKETGLKDSVGYPIVYVFFECSFFKGEYKLDFDL